MTNDPEIHGGSPTDPDNHDDAPTGSEPAGGAPRRKTLVIAGVLAVAIAIAAGLFLFRGAAEDEHDAVFKRFQGEQRLNVMAKEDDWLALADFPSDPDSAARLERAMAPISDAVDDRDGLLPDEALDSLMRTIHEHAAARSERSPERYLALCEAESELYEWIPLEENAVMNAFMDYWNLGAGPEGTPQSALRSYWNYFYDEKGDRFDAMGVPPKGSRIVIRKVRTKQQGDDMFFGYDEEDVIWHWTGELMLVAAQQFRRPRRPIEEVLKAQPGVVVAQVMILVRMANGHPINWGTSWYQDPETGRWICSWMVYKRARLTALVF